MNTVDLNDIFSLYTYTITQVIQHKNLFFDAELYELATHAWKNMEEKTLEIQSEIMKYIEKEAVLEKLEKHGLMGDQWEYKKSIVDHLCELLTSIKDNTLPEYFIILNKILHGLNSILGSLFSAIQIPGIELMKEFKDFIEISLKDQLV